MSLWRQITRGMRALTHRKAADQDVADEVEHYFEQATEDLIARGHSPEEARRAARLGLGSTTLAREEVRSYGWENVVANFFADLSYAARRLRRSPGFTAVSVATLALGLGACAAIFSAVYPVLFAPLPYPQPGRIMMIWDSNAGERSTVTFHTWREVAQRNHSFETVAAADAPLWQPSITGATQPERLDGQRVTADYFRVLGVSPAIGRDFQASDDRLDGPKVVILSDALWRRRFQGDPAIVGRQITLDGELWTVIGILPRSFENLLAPLARIWRPMQYDTEHASTFGSREWGHHLQMVGRLRQGVSPELARRDLNEIARSPRPEFPRPPWANLKFGFIGNALQGEITREVRPAMLAILGAVLLVLSIACVNVTNLLLARSVQRRGEMSVRVALGAGRERLVRQLLTESLLLAGVGGALGLLVAQAAVRTLVALAPVDLPRVSAIAVNGAVFAFALAITTLIGLAVGLVPAVHATREDVQSGLRQLSRQTVGSHQFTRRTLVVAEVSLALALLVSAGLLLRSLERLFSVDVGFRSSALLTMQVQETGRKYDADTARYQFFERARQAVERVPGVTAAAFTSQLPLSGDLDGYGIEFENEYNPQDDAAALRYAVSPNYFETMGIPLLRGRLLNEHDVPGAPMAVLISESLAKRKFPGRDPIGTGIRIGPASGNPKEPWSIIVGVVGDVKQTSLGTTATDAIYTTPMQWYWVTNPMSFVIRSSGDVAALAPAIRRAIWSVDKDQPVVRVATMDQLVAASESQRHFALVLFEVFGLMALVLAATGIYGVISGSVTERTREIGVRSALGATRGNIVTMVLGQGMGLTCLGAVIGLAGAVGASQAISTLLFGISRLDIITYLGVVLLLAGVSGLACWVPAWRAGRIDPAITLRAE
jgi:putative ABC transport system permease protein